MNATSHANIQIKSAHPPSSRHEALCPISLRRRRPRPGSQLRAARRRAGQRGRVAELATDSGRRGHRAAAQNRPFSTFNYTFTVSGNQPEGQYWARVLVIQDSSYVANGGSADRALARLLLT